MDFTLTRRHEGSRWWDLKLSSAPGRHALMLDMGDHWTIGVFEDETSPQDRTIRPLISSGRAHGFLSAQLVALELLGAKDG